MNSIRMLVDPFDPFQATAVRVENRFALCVDNSGYEASLVPGKVYPQIADARAAKDDMVRLADEGGEDYLFHESHFVFVESSEHWPQE